NKGQVFGLGFEAHVYNRTFTSPSPPLPTQPLPPPPPNPAMKDHIGRLETMMAIMREMRPPPRPQHRFRHNPRPQTRTIWMSLTT
ncbi:UNVERIFIED_CONTAM: hypothetical protein Sindi_2007400, partial [Sesamum indicum]